MTESFYDVLGVPADASEDAITAAYREQVKEHHPDVSEAPDAEERFKRIKRAEEVLTDPEERARYDRLGHERYVSGATAGEPTGDTVRAAAAQAADTSHDAGGRSAGWRERERRARGSPEDWFENDVGYDPSPGASWTHGDAAPDEGGPGADDARRSARSSAAGSGATRAGPGRETSGRSTARTDATGARGPRGDPTAAGVAHAATEAWGHSDSAPDGHAVHEWDEIERDSWRHVPQLTQDEFVLLGASILLYPIMLATTVFPPLPLVANAAMGVVTLAFVVYLLPRPAMAIPIFGTWSVGVPAILWSLEVPFVSLAGAVTLIGVWVPFGYSLAVAYVLTR